MTMLINLIIALSVVVVELLVMTIVGIFAYARLKESKNRSDCENSFSEVEQEDLIALSQELSKTNKEIFDRLEKLDDAAQLRFSPGMSAMRRGYQEALESMKMGASSLLSEPPNIPMTCQAFLEANRALMKAMSEATLDLSGQGLPVEEDDPAEKEAKQDPNDSEAPEDHIADTPKEEIMV